MKRSKSISLTVAEPCSEDWDQMTQTERGKHCSSCDKLVIDFSQMTDSQLSDFFKNYQGSTCGHFRASQLNRSIQLPNAETKRWFHWPRMVAASLLTAMSWMNVAAIPNTLQWKTEQLSIEHPEAQKTGDPEFKELAGSVVSLRTNGGVQARVRILGTNHTVKTDENGNFSMHVPLSMELTGKWLVVEHSSHATTVQLKNNDLNVKVEIDEPWPEVMITGCPQPIEEIAPMPFRIFPESSGENIYGIDGAISR